MSSNRAKDAEFSRRSIVAGVAGAALWTGLSGRLVQLQLLKGEEYAELATENRIRLDPAPARRGVIYDRFGQRLASNKRNFYVLVVPEETSNLEETLRLLARYIPISNLKHRRILAQARQQAKFVPIPVADDLSWQDFSRINVHAPEFKGVYAEVGELRSYPMGTAFSHTIGYVARPNREELSGLIEQEIARLQLGPDDVAGRRRITSRMQRIYRHPDMRLGRQGIEQDSEIYLRGTPGFQRIAVNASGRIVDRLPSDDVAPKDGGDIVLSFDAEIQKYAISRFGEESGSAVVMDIESGELLAMVSTPAFNPNDFVSGISQAKYNDLLGNKKSPLYHKAYDGLYPPGSTFKMTVAAAALESKVATPRDTVTCRGKTRFGGRDFHCWKRGGHGTMNMKSAIQHSCDVYFYEIARRIGVQGIADMAHQMGLGTVYDLGMTGGSAGVVPDPAWKQKALREQWYEGETLNYGIGQGYLTTSPLQLAVMTARIARENAAPAPKVIIGGATAPPSGAPPYVPLNQEIAEHLRAGMYAVTSEPGGTALRSGDVGNGQRLAGKTGTAQVRRISTAERATGVIKNDKLPWELRDHGLFVSYAPADNPKYVCVVVVDHGGGSSAAYPIARDIMTETLKRDPMSREVFKVSSPIAQSAPSSPASGAI
ncbi:penicillin-binding protein 2 [Hirschia litorea]|uniref:Penicillin-binding protein 2 n=1 Tax=Hirschia litorea TaxID=1199156 RepID=A0ABW2IL23_9PROT